MGSTGSATYEDARALQALHGECHCYENMLSAYACAELSAGPAHVVRKV